MKTKKGLNWGRLKSSRGAGRKENSKAIERGGGYIITNSEGEVLDRSLVTFFFPRKEE